MQIVKKVAYRSMSNDKILYHEYMILRSLNVLCTQGFFVYLNLRNVQCTEFLLKVANLVRQ